VSLKVALRDELPAVDRDRAQVERGSRAAVVRQIGVAEDDDRRLELVGEVEGLPREVERLRGVAGREDDPRELALRRVQDVAQVGLLGPRGQSGRGGPAA
jgi:hypothetical protein